MTRARTPLRLYLSRFGFSALALLALAGLPGHAAGADSGDGFGRAGGYFSVGAGGAVEAFSGPLDPGGTGLDFGTAVVIGGRLGYRAGKYVALEGTVDYTVKGLELSAPGVGSIEAKTLVATGNVKLYPLAGRVQPFAMGGAGIVRGTLECTAPGGVAVGCAVVGLQPEATVFAGRVGGGLDFYLTENLALTGEVAYVIPTGDLDNLDFLTFGGQVLFRF